MLHRLAFSNSYVMDNMLKSCKTKRYLLCLGWFKAVEDTINLHFDNVIQHKICVLC